MSGIAELLPALSAAEFAALKADIAERGVLVPIEVDEDSGEVLDGRHRLRACEELSLPAPERKLRRFTDEAARVEHAIKINLLRRQMDDEAWSDAFERLAELRQVRLGKGGDRKSEPTATMAVDLAAELGVSERTARRKRRNAKRIKQLRDDGHADLAEQVKAREIDLKRAERILRETAARELTAQREQAARDTIAAAAERLYRLDVADVRGWRPEGVACVITDPPYVGDSIPLYEALRDFALDVLPDGGALVVMTWQAILPQVVRALDDERLSYRWTICWRYANVANTVDHARRVFDCWKPVLVYHRGGMPADAPTIRDEIANADGDKDFHEWGQSVAGFERLVRSFSLPGDVVCDPFLGGGTTAVAALAQTRRFAGCDIDEAAVATAARRLEQGAA